jgi:hypothetical protein
LEAFHRKLAKSLEGPQKEEAAKKIIEDLNKLRQHILSAPANLHLVCNSKELEANKELPSDAWDFLNPHNNGNRPIEKITVRLG